MKTVNIKKYFLKPLGFLLIITLIFGCLDAIEFEVKADFEIETNVTSTSNNGSIVSTFNVSEATIDLSEKIDELGDINTLLITGVTLELKDYEPESISFGVPPTYPTDPLTGDLTVTLLSNSKSKILFKGAINLGTNSTGAGDNRKQNAPIVALPISPTEAKDLIENDKVKIKIEMTNGVIREKNFKINIVVSSETITGS